MKKPIFRLIALCLVPACLAGCGGESAPNVPTIAPASTQVALEPAPHITLETMLSKPRAELASEAAELEKKIHRQNELRLAGQLKFALLPATRVPLAPPVWHEAHYAAERGFSVPPYLKAGVKDAPLARHLARHGDLEAATGLAENAADAGLSAFKLDRNYPLEWTRLVGLLLHHAQCTLATDNLEGAKELLALHQQLRSLLPEAAQKCALGQALLPRGLDTLQQAAQAWRKQGRAQLAEQAEQFLAKLGPAPAWQWPLAAGRAELTTQLGLHGEGHGVPAAAPLRVLDLSCLPLAHDHLDACWTFFDGTEVREVLFAYRSTLTDYEQPAQWVPHFDRLRQSKPALTATLTPGNPYVGGVVQVRFGNEKATTVPRVLGPLSLDRTFEHNRRLFAWKQSGSSIAVKEANILATLPSLVPQAPRAAVLERDASHDLLNFVRLTYPPDAKQALANVAAPIWKRHGPAQVQVDRHVALVWNDGTTKWTLTLPNDREQPVVFEATDSSGADAAQRASAARARDLADRQTRLANNRPLSRLPRSLETLSLGMKRADVERLLPGGKNALRRDIPNGLMATYAGKPTAPGDAVLRTLFARFDDAGQLAELRVRYGDHPGNRPGTLKKRLAALQAAHGPGDASPLNPALAVDLPARQGAAGGINVWQDDVTRLTCTLEAGSLELAIRHCPAAHADGAPLPDFTYLPRGAEDLLLGMPRSDVVARGAAPHEGALLLTPKADSPFDSVLVWFENELVAKVVARYRDTGAPNAAQQLPETWGRELRTVGWPWRQDFVNNVLQSWTTSDAQTRYRVFWQEDNLGTHVLAEWRSVK